MYILIGMVIKPLLNCNNDARQQQNGRRNTVVFKMGGASLELGRVAFVTLHYRLFLDHRLPPMVVVMVVILTFLLLTFLCLLYL
ncbi:hypothetical protein L6452_33670 [Arctium lappa]|uniref:Uncharacterized protein n=1 Tax=Arctium lappa TaxID=4217 RepID=A0ACB8YH72_ARCLA|nr:hypothetical protein L6452_33670 [Arctium lappa]